MSAIAKKRVAYYYQCESDSREEGKAYGCRVHARQDEDERLGSFEWSEIRCSPRPRKRCRDLSTL